MQQCLFPCHYLAGWTFLHSANDHLSGQADQDVGTIVVQRCVVPIEGDDTQVRHYSTAT